EPRRQTRRPARPLWTGPGGSRTDAGESTVNTLKALANVNGTLMPLDEVRISALDRGFLFGDAIYEVLRVYGGRPWLLDEHLQRLRRSLESIRLAGVDVDRLRARMLETLAQSKVREGIIYIQVTRGAAPRSHPFPKNVT